MEHPVGSVTGFVHSTESFGAVDGPGVRYVIFLQGCPLRCLYCHNPDSWRFGEGTQRTAQDLVEEILEYRSFLKRGGVTLSGGEPFAQPDFTEAILTLCRENGLHTAVDTSGAIPLARSRAGIERADLLLLDFKAFEPEECRKLTGQDNRSMLQTLRFCEEIGKPVWIRHVCVPGYTLQEEPLKQMAGFLRTFSCIERVELIPFHQMGSYKWDYVGANYQLRGLPVPTEQEMEQARAIFRQAGLATV